MEEYTRLGYPPSRANVFIVINTLTRSRVKSDKVRQPEHAQVLFARAEGSTFSHVNAR